MANPFLSSVLDDASRPAEDPLDHNGDWTTLAGGSWLGGRGGRAQAFATIASGNWTSPYTSDDFMSAWDNGQQMFVSDSSVLEVQTTPLSSYSPGAGPIRTAVEYQTGVDTKLNIDLVQGTTVISHWESPTATFNEEFVIFPAVDTAAITDFDDLRLRCYIDGGSDYTGVYVTARFVGLINSYDMLGATPTQPGDGLIHIAQSAIVWGSTFTGDREGWFELDDDLTGYGFPVVLGLFDPIDPATIRYAALIYGHDQWENGSPTVDLMKLPFDDGVTILDQNYTEPTWAAGDILGYRRHSTGMDFYQWDGVTASLLATSTDTEFHAVADQIIIYSVTGELKMRSIGGGNAGAPPTSVNKLAMIL